MTALEAQAHSVVRDLADAWNILGDLRSVAQVDAFARGRAAAERALALDAALGEPHTSLGFVLMFGRSIQIAVENWRRGYSILERPGAFDGTEA